MDSFYEKIQKQLKKMTEQEKDAWILSQAKILPEWEHDFYDPDHAMTFLSSVFHSCHDLIVLEEYSQALEILDKVITLEFAIVDHPDTDDTCEDEYMSLDMAAHEGLISIHRDKLLADYILACKNAVSNKKLAAEKIAAALEMELFEDSKASSWAGITETDPLLDEIKKKLAEDLRRFEDEYTEIKTSITGENIGIKSGSDT